MRFPLLPRSLVLNHRPKSGLVASTVFLLVLRVTACGPDFPNTFLGNGEKELLKAPPGFFAAEIERLLPATPGGKKKDRASKGDEDETDQQKHLLEIDLADLTEALAKGPLGEEKRSPVLSAYRKARVQLNQGTSDKNLKEKTSEAITLPDGLPEEFRLYFLGAQAYHRKEFDAACAQWKALLDLPPEQRHYRSVWAAFMMGEALTRGAHDEAYDSEMTAWERTRQLAAEGASDRLDLATESLGSQGKAYFEHREYAAALSRYLEQAQAGDGSAVQSLRVVAREVLTFASADEFDQVIHLPPARQVISAYLIGEADRREAGVPLTTWSRWLVALEKAGVVNAPEADRLAWIAYQGGLFDLAERWSARAPEGAAMANWVRAKLALRHGKVDTAAEFLAKALQRLDPLPDHLRVAPLTEDRTQSVDRAQIDYAWAELGSLRMLQRRYEDALDAFMNGGHWEDSAYIAERVLKLSELEGWVLTHAPTEEEPEKTEKDYRVWSGRGGTRGVELEQAVRSLLARRLVRDHQFDKAEIFFPAMLKPHYLEYRDSVKAGFDATQPPEKRARAFWRAAQLARAEGLELMGTELNPDNHIWFGQYSDDQNLATTRVESLHFIGGPFQPTDDEMERVKSHLVPDRRFHYRARAAELAWWAASLLPNESEETATILHTAGLWLKAKDPQEANRFYQAIVIRCGKTELGKQVTERHWFLDTEEDEERKRVETKTEH